MKTSIEYTVNLDVCTMHFVEFYYICPANLHQI